MRILPSFRAILVAILAVFALAPPPTAAADTALVAVAANFAEAAEALVAPFQEASGHKLTLTTGSTGKLYAQIAEGAPFDVMLSADAGTPAKLVDGGHAVAGTAFTYATGRLTLWSSDPGRIDDDGRAALADPALRFVAIANPDLAPYGVAARETLQSLRLWETLQPKIVMGQNVGQTHAMVATGAAELGFVALSAVRSPRARIEGSRWDVPQDLYAPIRQDAVLLRHGAGNAAATAFLDFLRSDKAAAVIESFGYVAGD
ncbi:molybdate ABC transporter substrate-binding protein [Roseovarius sp. D22-M7]|uniref:molybdate ABC transporter substrate-binding protein n=1 Tax=Roseovarius sp. D22-M7 TaxID=3127116 RepID=UPI0030103546